jgi:hypothetical protein
MGYLVAPGTAVVHRYVFELRFDQGQLFWDRAGRVARSLAEKEGWEVGSIDMNGCHVRDEGRNLIFSFSATNLSLCQTQNQDVSELLAPGEFRTIAEEFSEAVIGTLELKSFLRIGFRAWTLYETSSLDDASDRISRSAIFTPEEPLRSLGDLSSVSYSAVVSRPKHMLRIAVAPFEQQINLSPSLIAAARLKAREKWADQRKVRLQAMKAKKVIKSYPALGIMLDLDAYIEDPPFPGELSCHDFVDQAVDDFGDIRNVVLQERS